jgi:hypothetical protein
MVLGAILLVSTAQAARAQNPFGVAGDLVVLKANQLFLKHDRARLQADIDRGDSAAIYRDLRRVRRDERSVEIDRWLLRSDIFLPNMFAPLPPRTPPVPPNPTLIPHPQYHGYGYFPSDPTHLYRLPETAAPGGTTAAPPQASIEVVNAGGPGTAVDFSIDDATYRVEGGRQQAIGVGPSSTIRYDRGGGLGSQRYALSAGRYEFRPGEAGWVLMKVVPTP